MRVLHVVPNLGSGGAERVVLTLLEALDPALCTLGLCVLGSENRFPSRLPPGIEPMFLGWNESLRDVRGLRRCVRGLRTAIRQFDADIVHSHLWPAARIASLAAAGLNVRHLVHIHDTRPRIAGTTVRDRIHRVFTRYALSRSRPAFVAVSQAAREFNCRHLLIPESAVHVIHNGVNVSEFRPPAAGRARAPHTPFVVGMAARFSPEKGHEHLLRAMAQLRDAGRKIELRLAGDGPIKADCVKLAGDLGLDGCVRFVGLIDDVPTFLQSLDAAVLPSVSAEGLPMTILEAMATGLPVVATRIAGAPEVIANEKNGILVPPADPQALATALGRLAENEPECRSLGQNALATVRDRFSLDAMTRGIEELYAILCPAAAPPAVTG